MVIENMKMKIVVPMGRFYSHGEGLCLGSRESWPKTSTLINLAILVMLTLALILVMVAVTIN